MKEVTIPNKYLRALLPLVPKTDIRYYLCGIFLDSKNGRMTVTNGHYLVLIECIELKKLPKDIIIPRQMVEWYLRKLTTRSEPDCFVEYSKKTKEVTLSGIRKPGGLLVKEVAKEIEGKYPDVSKVIDYDFTADSDTAGNFNYEYLAAIQKAAGVASGFTSRSIIDVRQTNNDDKLPIALISSQIMPEFKAVVMGLRG